MRKIIKVYYGKDLVATFKRGLRVEIGRETLKVYYLDSSYDEFVTTFDILDVRHYKIDYLFR